MNTQCWRPNEAHRILLGGKGKEELVKMATLLCISAQGALFFFSYSCYTEYTNVRTKIDTDNQNSSHCNGKKPPYTKDWIRERGWEGKMT